MDKFDFGKAVTLMKEGHRVAREGWNGRGMFLYIVTSKSDAATFEGVSGVEVPSLPRDAFIAMKTAQDTVVPWLASQNDMLCEDWTLAS